jgi:hypothetical protein
MRRPAALVVAIFLAAACGGREHPAAPALPRPAPVAKASAAPAPPPAAAASVEEKPASKGGETSPEDAERVLFLATDRRTDGIRKDCPVTLDPEPRIRCLLALRYEDEPASRDLALTLYTETGSLAGLLPEETSDDGHGGKVHLLPARPIRRNLEHLTWILAAFRDYQRFLKGLGAHGGAEGGTGASQGGARGPIAFRDRPVHFRFFYSEKGGNPSAFAVKRNIGYNLFGTVNVSEEAVRDTLFHEIFHLNDSRLEDWSQRALVPIFDQIVARCGQKNACLTPYSPTDTMIQGAFYAFSPQHGAREYAAELGLRYYREHRLVLEGKPLPVKAFKCGAPENLTAWKLLADEVFGGIDLVPGC